MGDSRLSYWSLGAKALALTAAAWACYLALLYTCASDEWADKRYSAAQFDKLARLHDTPGRRLVFLGGSNLAFGLDSGKIEKAFRLPVVNMGLNSGFGLGYILESAASLLHEGDWVVVVPEYEFFTASGFRGGEDLLWLARASGDAAAFLRVDPRTCLEANGFIFRRSLKPPEEPRPPYCRSCFNRYGDIACPLEHGSAPEISGGGLAAEDFTSASLERLEAFFRDESRRGIKVACLFPCYRATEYRRNQGAICMIEMAIKTRLPVPTGVVAEEFVYPDRLFYDTEYHLAGEGRTLRTEKVIRCLRPFMKL